MSAEAIVDSVHFFEMHKLEVDYETRDASEVLPVEQVVEGFRTLGIFSITLFNRPSKSRAVLLSKLGLKPGEIMIPIKFLNRMKARSNFTDAPPSVFFFGFPKYDDTLAKYQQKLCEHYIPGLKAEQNVQTVFQVPLGGLFGIKLPNEDKFFRVRVIEINVNKKAVGYWAIDEALAGTCDYSDLLILPDEIATLPMLAVPGVFDSDPLPQDLEKFEGSSKTYRMAKVVQPKYASDFGPRKIKFSN